MREFIAGWLLMNIKHKSGVMIDISESEGILLSRLAAA